MLVQTSPEFQTILRTLLSYGNYMNGGTKRGGIFGFLFDTFLTLSDVRGSKDRQYNGKP